MTQSQQDNTLNQIYENKPDHHFRVEIPKIIINLKLSGNEFLLYNILKSTAGDEGICWKSHACICEEMGISLHTLINCLKKLSSPFILLGGLPLIKITKRKKEDGGDDTNIITITPLWRINGDFFRSLSSERKKQVCTAKNAVPGVVQKLQGGTAKNADKEDPSEEDPFVCCLSKENYQENISEMIVVKSTKAPYVETIKRSKAIELLKQKPCTDEEINSAIKIIQENDCKISSSIVNYLYGIIKNSRKELQNASVNSTKHFKSNRKHTSKSNNPVRKDEFDFDSASRWPGEKR